MKKATLADVAALAEVSKATVSRYLKDENVKEDIALRIAKAIEETGYVAKAMKKAVEEEVKIEKKKRVLKKQNTVNRGYRIALLCDQVMLPRTREILDAICKELYTQGCLLQVYFTQNREDLEETYLTSCIVNNMDAILVMSCSSVEFIQKQMRTTAIPIIYLCAKGEGITSVTIPETQAAEVLGKYLMQKQHLMIRYLGSNVQLANLHMEGIKEAYREVKQPHDFAVKISDGSYLDTYARIKELFAEQLDLLILQDDALAIPFAKYVQEYHISVPQNVSVVSFGGQDLTRIMSPVMTSVVYDYHVFAQDVFAAVQALIEKKAIPQQKNMFYLQEGDSVR
ncbi:LacI family DNA-binding transcriptional regulator [Longicatena caecimuris]|uniref:LacI family DNA-binding transcriptional regulator n=1 Tax=Longicatena caecimuris TaxID=1796635 RepID=UPI0018AADDF6|nr:LacI family DNA-binding transcriptional regulator [Longicatena caecimuris]